MPNSRQAIKFEGSAGVFAALGDSTRLKLVARLCDEGPKSITELAKGMKVSRQAITKHLRVMEEAGLARSHRQGRKAIWELDKRSLRGAQNYLDQISSQWNDAILRLQKWVQD